MLKYSILGVIQGLTEFLPVSSSAHLLIMQNIFKINAHQLAISVVLHLGTTLALIVFFFKDIIKLWRDTKTLLYILVASLITAIIALWGKDFFAAAFASPKFAACALAFTGIILLFTKRIADTKRQDLNLKDSLIFGFSQGLSIIPGISRSGLTISTLLFRGIDRQTSFKFSFLAAIPAVLGAVGLEAREINCALQGEFKHLVVGFLFSFLSGILSLTILKKVLQRAKFHYFGYYCILVAIVTLLLLR